MCRVLRVSAGGYYDWRGRPQSTPTQRRDALVVAINEVHGEDYQTREEARASIFEYVEVFYNRFRRHTSLGYLSPAEYELAA